MQRPRQLALRWWTLLQTDCVFQSQSWPGLVSVLNYSKPPFLSSASGSHASGKHSFKALHYQIFRVHLLCTEDYFLTVFSYVCTYSHGISHLQACRKVAVFTNCKTYFYKVELVPENVFLSFCLPVVPRHFSFWIKPLFGVLNDTIWRENWIYKRGPIVITNAQN